MPATANTFSIAVFNTTSPSPQWAVYNGVTGGYVQNEATLPTPTGDRAPTMAEVNIPSYGRWYVTLVGAVYTDLGRKS